MKKIDDNNQELVEIIVKYPPIKSWLDIEEMYDEYLGARITHKVGGFDCDESQKYTAPTGLAKLAGFYSDEWKKIKDKYEGNILDFLKHIYEAYEPYIFIEDENSEVEFYKADSVEDYLDRCTKAVKFYYELDDVHRKYLKDGFDKLFVDTDVQEFYLVARDMPMIICVNGIELYGYSKKDDDIKPIHTIATNNQLFTEQEEL